MRLTVGNLAGKVFHLEECLTHVRTLGQDTLECNQEVGSPSHQFGWRRAVCGRLIECGDSFDPQLPSEVIKSSSHRKGFGKPINEDEDALAGHRRKLYDFATIPQPSPAKENELRFVHLSGVPSERFSGLQARHERGIIHGDVIRSRFLGTTEAIVGFIGDLDLAKVELEHIKTLFQEWYEGSRKAKGEHPERYPTHSRVRSL